MNYAKYRSLFDAIIENPLAHGYDNPEMVEYVRLNIARHDRWKKKGTLTENMIVLIEAIDQVQNWVLISEPWCGDAAHSTPFINKMAQINPNICLEVQLRDDNSEIDQYLTNGGKSIPILLVRDENNIDLFTWGPRPEAAQVVHLRNLVTDKTMDEKKIELQQWYNQDKGQMIQLELFELLTNHSVIPKKKNKV